MLILSPRVSFVEKAADGRFVLTADAYRYLRDVAPVIGIYTPTLTNVTNIAASTAYPCQYISIGSVVTVSGKVDIDPTAGAVASELGMTIPVASNFANDYECSGTGVAPSVDGLACGISADATNNRAKVSFVSAIVANSSVFFTFTYQVL